MSETQLASMFIGSADDGDDIDRGRPSDVGNMIHILDGQTDVILDFITLDNIIDDTHKKSLEDTLETYDFIALADKRYAAHLEKRNRIIIPDEDGTLREFVIFEAAKYRDAEGYKAQVFSHASYLELKKARILYPTRREGLTASQHAGWALNDTGWRVGIVEAEGTRTFTIENHTNPYEFLKRIAREFEVELRFRVEHDGQRITGRYVDLLERVGEWRGREIEFGKDLDGIRRVEKQDIVTALLGLGPERDDGTRIEVLVTDEDALQRWGRVDEHGNLHHLIEPYEIQSDRQEMTEEEARRYTRTALDKRINTQVTYETTILDLEEVPGLEHEKIRFGDTIRIKDTYFNPPLYIEARVFEIERSIKNKAKKDIKLGDYIEYTEEEVHAIWRQLRNQIRRRITAAQLVEYAEPKKVESNTPPPIKEGENPIWVDTSKTPHVPHVVIANEWVKMSPTEAQEVGAETPQGAQEKADTAEQNAKSYTDIIKSDLEDGIRQAQTTADGKNTVFRQSSQPPTSGRKIGDVWFDTSRDNLMHVFNGTQWVEAKWGEQSIVANSITANHIKSLVGLNVNDQFIVDSQGNVKFAGHLEGATGSFRSEGKFEDDYFWVNIDRFIELGGTGLDNYKTLITYFGIEQYDEINDYWYYYGWGQMSVSAPDRPFLASISVNESGLVSIHSLLGDDPRIMLWADDITLVGDVNAYGTIYAGTPDGFLTLRPGNNHGYVEFYRTEGRVAYVGIPSANSEHFVINASGVTGELRLTGANVYVSERLINPAAYQNTTSSAANGYIASNGYFGRSTSSERYKQDIRYCDVDYKKILNLKQASWYDKGEVERNEGTTEGLRRYYGAIAEDFERIGLPEYIIYNEETGEVENFSDRAWVLLIPNINDILHELEQIKERLERLENEGNSV